LTTEQKTLVGEGDNVFTAPANVQGILRHVRSVAQVLDYMDEGVPADTIALIDDSGGTLTAPIMNEFKAVICKGGTVRSHLGIVTREFRIPCLMNASIDESQIKEGDRVEVEYSAQAASLEQYHGDAAQARAKIWKLG
jgi:phosphoenolpyruvate-protein kinase (PTS system EI component)